MICLNFNHDTKEWSFITSTILNNLADNNTQVQEHLDKQMVGTTAPIHKVIKNTTTYNSKYT